MSLIGLDPVGRGTRIGVGAVIIAVLSACGSSRTPRVAPDIQMPLISRVGAGGSVTATLSALESGVDGRRKICLRTAASGRFGVPSTQAQCYRVPLPSVPLFVVMPTCARHPGGFVLGLTPAGSGVPTLTSPEGRRAVAYNAIPENRLAIQGNAFAGVFRRGPVYLDVSSSGSRRRSHILVTAATGAGSCRSRGGDPQKPTGP
jgi:hypothetical protein